MNSAAEEMGQELPKTRVQRSGRGFGHFIFKHTDRSRKLGNRSVNLNAGCTCDKQENRLCNCRMAGKHHHHEWFSFRAQNRYLVGAGSKHPDGGYYTTLRDIDPTPVPDWVCDFVERHSEVPKAKHRVGSVSVSEEFDFDDFCDFYDLGGHEEGDWFITDECPVAGYRHQGSFKTGFFYDGNSLGFNCFAQGCDGSNMSVGQVIGHLNKEKGEPYKGIIWDKDEDDEETILS